MRVSLINLVFLALFIAAAYVFVVGPTMAAVGFSF